jgi:Ca-activated chloride channel family protein
MVEHLYFRYPWHHRSSRIQPFLNSSIIIPALLVTIAIVSVGELKAQRNTSDVEITPRLARRQQTKAGTIRSDVRKVLVPASVMDTKGSPVEGLQKHHFRIMDSGIEQQVVDFYQEDGPVALGVVLDASKSMRDKFHEAQQVISGFLRLSVPGDEFFLVTFQDRPRMVTGFTSRPEDVEAELSSIQPDGWTSLFDALVLAIHQIRRASQQRRVLLVLTDGEDNNSRYKDSEVISLVREANVRILSIAIQYRGSSLEKLAAESGGRTYRVRDVDRLPELAATLSADVHAQYILGFSPDRELWDGKYHELKLNVIPPVAGQRFNVVWRRGYYASLE